MYGVLLCCVKPAQTCISLENPLFLDRQRLKVMVFLCPYPVIARSTVGSSCGGMAAAPSNLTASTCTNFQLRPWPLVLLGLTVFNWSLGVRW